MPIVWMTPHLAGYRKQQRSQVRVELLLTGLSVPGNHHSP